MKKRRGLCLFLALGTILVCHPILHALGRQRSEQVVQRCAEYSDSGALLTASVSDRSFSISIARPTGQVVAALSGNVPEVVHPSSLRHTIAACQLAVSPGLPTEAWDAAWSRAHAQVEEQPGDHPEAQLKILTIVAIDVAHGREAAREATAPALAELAMTDLVRDSLGAFLRQ